MRIRRDFCRAAALRWMTPFWAALSMRLTALPTASSASSVPRASSAERSEVRSSLRTALLRVRALSFWRLRLIWLLMLAMGLAFLVCVCGVRGWRNGKRSEHTPAPPDSTPPMPPHRG